MTAPMHHDVISWQPIDTAPQDGTSLLLHDVWCQHMPNAYYVGHYCSKSAGAWKDGWWSQGYSKNPTHWSPFKRYEGPLR